MVVFNQTIYPLALGEDKMTVGKARTAEGHLGEDGGNRTCWAVAKNRDQWLQLISGPDPHLGQRRLSNSMSDGSISFVPYLVLLFDFLVLCQGMAEFPSPIVYLPYFVPAED